LASPSKRSGLREKVTRTADPYRVAAYRVGSGVLHAAADATTADHRRDPQQHHHADAEQNSHGNAIADLHAQQHTNANLHDHVDAEHHEYADFHADRD
jgi:hypothetical protein